MPANTRDGYLETLAHVREVYDKVRADVGRGHLFSFPDVHKLTEGLFLSALTYWEAFLQDLMALDLASDIHGVLRRDVKKFRTRGAPYRLSEYILTHPDHPKRFVDWGDYNVMVQRANEFLGPRHRFVNPLPQGDDLSKLNRIRNAIAHKSDKAWESFLSLVSEQPFALTPRQRRGITPGRFLYGHQWNGISVMEHSIATLEAAAHRLVP